MKAHVKMIKMQAINREKVCAKHILNKKLLNYYLEYIKNAQGLAL